MVVSFIVISSGRLFQSFAYCFFSGSKRPKCDVQPPKNLDAEYVHKNIKICFGQKHSFPIRLHNKKHDNQLYTHVLDVKRCQIRRFVSQKLYSCLSNFRGQWQCCFSPILKRCQAYFKELCFLYLEHICFWCDYICTNSCGVSKSEENFLILVLS